MSALHQSKIQPYDGTYLFNGSHVLDANTALVIRIDEGYFVKFARDGRALTAWSLAGATLFGGWREEVSAQFKRIKKRRPKADVRVQAIVPANVALPKPTTTVKHLKKVLADLADEMPVMIGNDGLYDVSPSYLSVVTSIKNSQEFRSEYLAINFDLQAFDLKRSSELKRRQDAWKAYEAKTSHIDFDEEIPF